MPGVQRRPAPAAHMRGGCGHQYECTPKRGAAPRKQAAGMLCDTAESLTHHASIEEALRVGSLAGSMREGTGMRPAAASRMCDDPAWIFYCN